MKRILSVGIICFVFLIFFVFPARAVNKEIEFWGDLAIRYDYSDSKIDGIPGRATAYYSNIFFRNVIVASVQVLDVIKNGPTYYVLIEEIHYNSFGLVHEKYLRIRAGPNSDILISQSIIGINENIIFIDWPYDY